MASSCCGKLYGANYFILLAFTVWKHPLLIRDVIAQMPCPAISFPGLGPRWKSSESRRYREGAQRVACHCIGMRDGQSGSVDWNVKGGRGHGDCANCASPGLDRGVVPASEKYVRHVNVDFQQSKWATTSHAALQHHQSEPTRIYIARKCFLQSRRYDTLSLEHSTCGSFSRFIA